MKKVNLDSLPSITPREKVQQLASSLKKGEGIEMHEAAKELGISIHSIRHHVAELNATVQRYQGRYIRAYLVNPKYNKS